MRGSTVQGISVRIMDNKGYYYEDRSNVPYNRNRSPKGNGAAFAMIIVGALLVCVLSAVISSVVTGRKLNEQKSDNVIIYKSNDEHPLADQTGDESMSVSQVFGLAKHSVVEIETETTVYGGFYGNYIASGAGSGVIISQNGYVITNLHVIDDADNISVTLADGSSCGAHVHGIDEKTDLAVIKLDSQTQGLIPAVIGKSSSLVVGETVVAIGNPLGNLGGTVTDGIISAIEREITVDSLDMVLLQTNAAVNPGNSGGGLFNTRGELIGIINAKSSDVSIEGIGFAIPIDSAAYVTTSIIEKGYVPGRVDCDATDFYEIDNIDTYSKYKYVGLYIVSDTGPFESNDYIISLDGKPVTNKKDWRKTLINHDARDVVRVVVLRNNIQVPLDYILPEKTR